MELPTSALPLTTVVSSLPCPLSSGLFCEHPPPMVLLQTSPCDQYECQNGAQCIVVQQEPTCRCPPGFAGPRCEKLITVNFVGKDSYVELASAKVRPQANISLQVCSSPSIYYLWKDPSVALLRIKLRFPRSLASLPLLPEHQRQCWALQGLGQPRAVCKKPPGESHSGSSSLLSPRSFFEREARS